MPASSPAAGSAEAALRPRNQALRLFLAHFWFKSLGSTAFAWAFFAVYLDLLHHPLRPVTLMPLTALDRWIGVDPWALPVYLSLWVYVSLPAAFMGSRIAVASFGLRLGLLCAAGLGIFALWPSAVPPLHANWAAWPGMAMLKHVDATGNACPSLHVASAVFAAIEIDRLLGRGAPAWRAASWCWCLAIAWSTLATKQHVVIDVAAGAALALAVSLLTRSLARP